MDKKLLYTTFIVLIISAILFFYTLENNPKKPVINSEKSEIIASDLNIPWEIAFLPNEEMLITERPGNLIRIKEDKKIIKVAGVEHKGEGGLLGLEPHPDFKDNNWIYLYFTSSLDGKIENRIERYKLNLEKNILEEKKIILSGIPGASYHDGGRIKFGPDGYLYITTGDATNPEFSQDVKSLAGKILRISDEGEIPEDNPFNNAIYSYGHRNSQGIVWDDQGNLWATEHGRSGIQSGLDELNLIKKGKNYGWDIIQGDEKKEGMESPIIHSGDDITWAPSSAVFYKSSIFFTGLRGETLYEYNIKERTLKGHFKGEFGRLRALTLNDNALYISTSNRDGRGNPFPNDDKIIRISLDYFDK